MTLDQAVQVAKEARQAFGVKTTNKMYDKMPPQSSPVSMNYAGIQNQTTMMLLEAVFADAQRKPELQKAIKRNQTATNSHLTSLRAHNPLAGKPFARGRAMFDSPGAWLATGNCGELAAVAAYRAIVADGTVSNATYLATIGPPGDHVFCVVGSDIAPAWDNVAAMAQDYLNWTAIVIDPWMNFACCAFNYAAQASVKLDRWLKAGKRIFWDGPQGPGWYQPAAAYEQAFMSGRLRFETAV